MVGLRHSLCTIRSMSTNMTERILSTMNEFLQLAREAIDCHLLDDNWRPVNFVVGNEACDLDSAISALCLAYYYTNQFTADIPIAVYAPLLNIRRSELPLKGELSYLCRRYNINADLLICRDDVPEVVLALAEFVLVDHHVATPLTPANRVFQIFDHRPLDMRQLIVNSNVVWKKVGSCATIIANLIHKRGHLDLVREIAPLLRATILLDTVNLSKAAGKAQPLDHQMVEQLEVFAIDSEVDRADLVERLVAARCDISGLTTMQILYKDMKIYRNSVGSMALGLPGMPILVEDFLRRPDAVAAVKLFCEQEGCLAAVLIGMVVDEAGTVRRDLAIVHMDNGPLLERARELILSNEDAKRFELSIKEERPHEYILLEQRNIQISRKQILPVFKALVESEYALCA